MRRVIEGRKRKKGKGRTGEKEWNKFEKESSET
jgi:hypothetical protein